MTHGIRRARRAGAWVVERIHNRRMRMRLSAEMYEQIVAGLKSDTHADKDKRREPRVGMAGEAELVTVNEDGKRIAGVVRVRDISRTGIGLYYDQRLTTGQHLVIQLKSENKPIWLVCTTAYCRAVDGGRFSVGARIKQVMRADQIKKVEARTAVAPPPVKKTELSAVDIDRISKAILS